MFDKPGEADVKGVLAPKAVTTPTQSEIARCGAQRRCASWRDNDVSR